MRPTALAIAVLCAAVTISGEALPQKSDQDAAIALFNEAKTLMDAHDYAAACPKLATSQKLSPALGTLLNLARCYEGEGKTASAWAGYREVAVFAEKAGQKERAAVAKELADKLEKKLSRLRIEIQDRTEGLAVRRDGALIETALLGTPVAVDPGEHTVEASAPGHRTWSSKVSVGKESDLQIVRIPKLEEGESAPATTALPTATATLTAPPPETPKKPVSLRAPGFVIGGAGLAVLAAGAVLGIVATAETQRLQNDPALCPQKVCSEQGYSQLQTTTAFGWAATGALGLGAAALGAGAIMVLISPTRPTAAGPSGAALQLVGRF